MYPSLPLSKVAREKVLCKQNLASCKELSYVSLSGCQSLVMDPMPPLLFGWQEKLEEPARMTLPAVV